MEQFKTKTQTIFYFLRGAKKYFFLSILCAMCVSFLEMINPRIISFTVDSVIGQKEAAGAGFTAWAVKAAGGIGRLRENPWLLALAVGIVGIAAAAARYGFRVSNAKGAELFVRVSTNYKQLQTMYWQRKDHKLKEDWGEFCKFVEQLPYAKELIIGEGE